MVTGTCSFKFYDTKEDRVRPLRFQAYGRAAIALNQSGIGSVQVISGRLNIYKPSQENPKHQMLLTIEQTTCVKQGQATTPVAPVQQSKSTAKFRTASVTATAPKIASTNSSAPEVEYDEIPF